MRSEQEMFELILGVARQDDRIRAAYMNGSRANPNVKKDLFQDYDIVYLVTETASFLEDEGWISVFGELLMVQEPDKLDQMLGRPVDFTNNYGYLMLFKDGSRIDLHITTREEALQNYQSDSLSVPLLDKDGCLPLIPSPSDKGYHIKPPTQGQYQSACNDFWWCMQNVAKGIWRRELPYVKNMLEQIIRPHLDKMVCWWIGTQHHFAVTPGKMGKYFENYLPQSYWESYQSTYCGADYEKIWGTVFRACDLFRSLAQEVAASLGFVYPLQDDQNMTGYLKWVSGLPTEI